MKSKNFCSYRSIGMALIGLASINNSHAQTWLGASATNAWETGANWSTGVVPDSAGDVITVTNNTTISLGSTRTVGTVNHYGSGNLVIGSTTDANSILNLDNGVSAGVFNITNSSGLVFVYSDLTGNNGFTKTGAGTLAFRYNTRNLNYSGPINLSAGKLVIDRDGSLGNAANDVSMGAGSVLIYHPGVGNASTTLGSGRTITFTNAGEFGMEVVGTGTMTVQGDVVSGGGVVADFRKYGTGNLDLQGAVNYTGNTIISGGNLKLSSSTTLASGKNIDFRAAGGIDFSGSTQTVNGIILATASTSARTFILTNGNVSIGSGSQITFGGSNGTVFNASGLEALNIDMGSGKNFTVRPDTNAAASTNQWILAGQGVASNSIRAANVTIGTASGSAGTANQGELHLGKINVINTTNFLVGGFNGSGLVKNQTGVTSSDLKVRSVDGTGALPKWTIGESSSGSRSGAGVVNLNGGSLDAEVTDLLVGRHLANANNGSASSLDMGSGFLVATTMVLGDKSGTGTPTLTSTMTQSNGEAKIGTLIFGRNSGTDAPNFQSSYNLSGGTLFFESITNGVGTYSNVSRRRLNWSGGNLRNYPGTNSTINGVATTEAGYVIIRASGAGTKTVLIESNRSMTFGVNTWMQVAEGEVLIDAPGAFFNFNGGLVLSPGDASPLSESSLTLSNGTANFTTAGRTFGMSDNTTTSSRLNVFGGVMTINAAGNRFMIGNKGTAVVNVSNGAVLNLTGANAICVGGDIQYADVSGNDLGNGTINLDGGVINVTGTGRFILGAFTYNDEWSFGAGHGTLNLNSGVFASGRAIERDQNTNNTGGYGSAQINFNGATLRALSESTNWITVTNLFVNADTVIDTETNNVNVQTGFLAGSNGVAKIIKAGSGTLTLSGVNTYAGDTDVDAGALSLLGTVASPSINVAGGAVLVLSTAPISPITNNLVFSDGAKVRVNGTPSSSVDLLTTSGSGTISGSPTLETPIPGYTLVTSGTAITLQAIEDTAPPTITLRGDNPTTIALGSTFTDPGADVTDNLDATRLIYGAGTVNSNQAGSYDVLYSASDAANNVAIPVIRTVNVLKGIPTLSEISANALTEGQSFADATVTGSAKYNGVNVEGTWAFANGQTLNGTGNYNVVFIPTNTDNYDSNTGSVSLTVNPTGTGFANWSGGGSANSELVGKYAIGGASDSSAIGEKPVATLDNNTLSLSAIVRTNDAKLKVVSEAGGSLTNWSTNGISVTASTNTNGVPIGHQRRVFSVDRANAPTKQFLRLKATLEQ